MKAIREGDFIRPVQLLSSGVSNYVVEALAPRYKMTKLAILGTRVEIGDGATSQRMKGLMASSRERPTRSGELISFFAVGSC